MEVTTVGIDLAKRIFHIHGVYKNGKTVLKKTYEVSVRGTTSVKGNRKLVK